MTSVPAPGPDAQRLDYLDAVRAFALTLGIVFHASLSFVPIPIGWAVMDVSTSPLILAFIAVSHSFRMELFFLIAGFFGHMTFHRKGARPFLQSRFIRIVVPFLVGWFILRPLIVSGWIMGITSLRGDVDVWAGLLGGFASLESLPVGIFSGTHLWFLYYLTMVTVGVLAVRGVLALAGAWRDRLAEAVDGALTWLADSWLALPVFVVPTAVVVWFMRGWGMDTPDQTLQPHVPVLLVYGGCFAFGWMLHRTSGLIDRFTQLTAGRWIAAVVGSVATVLLARLQADTSHPHYLTGRMAFVASYALMMWSLVFLTIGVFRKVCARPNRIVRFVADSSYWMYLVHLPIVVWLQVAVAEWPVNWTLKMAGVSLVTIGVCLVTYDLFVRSTFLGWILNGRRRERMVSRVSRADRPARLGSGSSGRALG